MSDGIVAANGVDLWYEDLGHPAAQCVLLISGATAQATFWWRQPLLDALGENGYRVVRFDNRDIGHSTWVNERYTLDDMAADTVALMDALGISSAHLVGASMGAMIAQLVAIANPERVLSLTTIASSPWLADPALPRPSPQYMAAMNAPAPGSPGEAVAFFARIVLAMNGSRNAYSDDEARMLAREALTRAQNPACAHTRVTAEAPDRRACLRGLDIPSLVIHGTDDPVIGIEHGRATADAIPGAELLEVEGLGHALPLQVFSDVVPALLANFRRR